MRRFVLPEPPNPDDPQYKGNVLAWQRDMFRWALTTKGHLEIVSRANIAAAGPYLATNFTTNTTISGTSTGTDVANALATLAQLLTSRGIIAPVVNRN